MSYIRNRHVPGRQCLTLGLGAILLSAAIGLAQEQVALTPTDITSTVITRYWHYKLQQASFETNIVGNGLSEEAWNEVTSQADAAEWVNEYWGPWSYIQGGYYGVTPECWAYANTAGDMDSYGAGREYIRYTNRIDLTTATNYVYVSLKWKWYRTWGYAEHLWSGGPLQTNSIVDYGRGSLPLGQVTWIDTGWIYKEWVDFDWVPNTEYPPGSYNYSPSSWDKIPVEVIEGWSEGKDHKCTTQDVCELDPIGVLDGSVIKESTDVVIPCPGLPLWFKRSYRSTLDKNGPLGNRWTHSYNWRLSETNTVFGADTNTWQILLAANGKEYWFCQITNGVYESPFDQTWLLVETNSKHEVTMPGGVVYTFGTNGMVETIEDLWQNTLAMTYTNVSSSNLLARVEHSNGQYLDLTYSGNKLSRVDTPNTNFYVQYSYNSNEELTNVTRSISGDDQVTTYSYDASTNHSMTQMVNAISQVYAWEYATNAAGETTSVGTGSVVAAQYFKGTLDFSAANQAYTTITFERGDTNQTYEYHYHPVMGRLTDIRGPNSVSTNSSTLRGTAYELDNRGNATNTVVYDVAAGQSLKTVQLFDVDHNVTNESFGLGINPSNTWVYGWDTNVQLLTSAADPEGHKVEMTYTNGSLLSAKVYYDGASYYESFCGYTTNGLVSGITNANGHHVSYYYDGYGFLTSAVPQLGPTVTYANNILGMVESVTLPGEFGDRTTSFDVDDLGRVTQVTYPNSLTETMSYDAIGNLTNHVDTAGRVTRYLYAPTMKLTSVVHEASGGDITNTIAYDNQFNSMVFKDAAGQVVEAYELDIQDRPVTVTNVEGQTMSVNYGVADYVKSITRFDGTVVANMYNTDGLLATAGYPDTTNMFTYFRNDLLKTVGNEVGTITNSYNEANRLTNSIGVGPNDYVSYTYMPAGQVSNATSIAGTTAYDIDAADRISGIDGAEGKFTFSFNQYNGLVSRMTCTNTGVMVDYDFNSMDQVTGITWRDSSSNVLYSFAYGIDNAFMITNVTRHTGEKLDYTYDDLDRLTGEKRISAQGETLYDIDMTYDAVGNRTQKTQGDLTVTYSCTNANRMNGWALTTGGSFSGLVDVYGSSSETVGTYTALGQLWVSNSTAITPAVDGTNFVAYDVPVTVGTQEVVAAVGDAAGNTGYATNTVILVLATNASYGFSSAGCVTSMAYTCTDGTTVDNQLSWNSRYQLTSVTTNGATAETYEYGPLGRRTKIVSGGETGHLLYDGIHVIAEVDASGVLEKSYTYGSGVDNLLAFTDYTGGSTNTYYALTDHLGSVHALVNSSGTVVEFYRYDAWGKVLGVYDADGKPLCESAVGNRVLWQGREYSWATGLYYFRARWYDPVTGRWLSKDPIGISGGLNQYVGCANNPVNNRDPLGLDVIYLVDDTIAALAYQGHAAALVGSDRSGWTYYSFGVGRSVRTAMDNYDVKHYRTLREAIFDNPRYDLSIRYRTSECANKRAKRKGNSFFGRRYNLFSKNCSDVAAEILKAAGVDFDEAWRPVQAWRQNVANDESDVPVAPVSP